jgi:hypothetical protein
MLLSGTLDWQDHDAIAHPSRDAQAGHQPRARRDHSWRRMFSDTFDTIRFRRNDEPPTPPRSSSTRTDRRHGTSPTGRHLLAVRHRSPRGEGPVPDDAAECLAGT